MTSNLHCASCGRLDRSGPDGVEPITHLGQKWCTFCAAIGRTAGGATYVSQPSPGRMTQGSTTDPLEAWEDCYSKTPKKRILVKRAKAEIERAWENWDGDKSGELSMFTFYWQLLARFRPYFLTFRCKGDPWQTVHSWLLRYEGLKKRNAKRAVP